MFVGSARRHDLAPITLESWPSVSDERSASASCVWFRAVPGRIRRTERQRRVWRRRANGEESLFGRYVSIFLDLTIGTTNNFFQSRFHDTAFSNESATYAACGVADRSQFITSP